MNWVDAAVIGIMLVYALIGVRRGFLAVASELVALAAGLAAAYFSFRPLGSAIAASRHWPEGLLQGVAFLVVWFVIQFIVSLVFHLVLRGVPREVRRGAVNRAWGIPPSLAKGLIAAALFVTLASVWRSGTAADDVARSRLGAPLANVVLAYQRPVYNTFAGFFRDAQKLFHIQTEVEGERRLAFHTTAVTVDSDAEARMLQMVNKERVSRKLAPLVMDQRLRAVARAHSRDMFARGYFAHESPDGKSPFDRMHAAGITYRLAGENLALAPTVEVAHDGLMHSPGHRKNILTPEFRRVGIGAVRGGIHGTMFSQEFTN
jgi:uncharacterized protein YkwD